MSLPQNENHIHNSMSQYEKKLFEEYNEHIGISPNT